MLKRKISKNLKKLEDNNILAKVMQGERQQNDITCYDEKEREKTYVNLMFYIQQKYLLNMKINDI